MSYDVTMMTGDFKAVRKIQASVRTKDLWTVIICVIVNKKLKDMSDTDSHQSSLDLSAEIFEESGPHEDYKVLNFDAGAPY